MSFYPFIQDKVLSGTCTYSMVMVDLSATSVLLDVRDLDISSIKLQNTGKE